MMATRPDRHGRASGETAAVYAISRPPYLLAALRQLAAAVFGVRFGAFHSHFPSGLLLRFLLVMLAGSHPLILRFAGVMPG
ncbi:protein of unknown function [Paraburkholderia kururiensis]